MKCSGAWRCLVLFSVLLVVLCLRTEAQETADSLSFDPVEVKGDRITPSEAYRVTRLDSSELADHSFQDLGSLLEERSGVQIRRYGPSGTASLSFRGTRSNETRMYWNGLPLRSPTLGQADLSLVPTFFLDEVSLHHGGASAVDGTGGIGGSLHLKSDVDRREPLRISLEGRAASFGDRMGGADVQVNEGKFGSRTRLFYRSADNDFLYPDVTEKGTPEKKRRNAGIERMGGMQEFHLGLGEGHELFAKGWYFHSSRDIPTPIDQVERGQHQEDRNLNSMLGWRWSDDSTRLSFRSGYFYTDLVYSEEISELRSPTTTHSWRNRFQGEHRFTEDLRVEGSWSHEREYARSSGYEGRRERVYDRGYLQLEKEFGDRFLLQGMVQEEWVDGDRVPLMPSAGMDLKLLERPELHWKANASRTYRVPTLNDLYWQPGGNPQLRPQEGWSYESGVSAEFGKERKGFGLRMEATAFLLEMDDRIVWTPQSSGYWGPINIDRSRDKGVEFSISGDFSLHDELVLSVRGDHTYVDAEVIDQVEDQEAIEGQAIYVPSHRGSGTLGLEWREKNRLKYGLVHTGERFIDRDNERYLPAYTLQRLHLERELELRDGLRFLIRGGVRNLFDVPYHSVAWHPMPGRTYELSLRLQFAP